MLASPRAKSEEFASATLSGSVFRTPTHFANAAWVAASSALSLEAGVPFQPGGRSAGCSTIFFSCASGAGAADDGAAELLLDVAALLDGAVELALGVEGDLDEEVQAANRVTAHPTAQTGMRRLIRMTGTLARGATASCGLLRRRRRVRGRRAAVHWARPSVAPRLVQRTA